MMERHFSNKLKYNNVHPAGWMHNLLTVKKLIKIHTTYGKKSSCVSWNIIVKNMIGM